MFFPPAVDLDPLTTDSNSSVNLLMSMHNSAAPYDDKCVLMSTISSIQISNLQPMRITSSIVVVTRATTNILVPTSFNEDDTKRLAVWSSIGRPLL